MTSDLKKILELCLSPDAGGLELYVVRASEFLNKKAEVISVINESGKLEEFYKERALKYEKVKRHSTLLSFLTAKKVAKIIDEYKIELIHLHWTRDIAVAVLAKKFSTCKPKIVQTRHMTMTRFKDDFYHRWLYKNVDMMLAVTNQVKEQVERFIPQDIRPLTQTLYIGADTPKNISQEEKEELKSRYALQEPFTVGIVGRIEEPKGQHLVVDAVKKLRQEGLHVGAIIVGHAMDESYLMQLNESVKADGLEEKIIFTGFTKEAQKLMQLCDCIVLATQKETFGLVLIEAMACGIAVIATNNGGPLEIVDDGKTGLLFEKEKSESLAQKIRALIENPQFKRAIADAGKEKADAMFESTKQFERLYEVLESL